MTVRLLIIDDDPDHCANLSDFCEDLGWRAQTACSAHEAEYFLHKEAFSLIALDVTMPGMDGVTFCRRLRERGVKIPILMLTARSDLEDRIRGLNAGADYYLTKPFDSRELLACVNALLRRQGDQVDELRMGNTALNLASCMLECGENSVRLSAREFDVMRFLLQSKGRVLSKEMILARVWGYDSNAVENHVEVYVGFLRKKLASIGSNLKIEAIRRLGYHLEAEE